LLKSLSINNVVLIDKAEIEFAPGLCVLSGETGSGKSILLDALGLAIGFRSNLRLIGEVENKAQVLAEFKDHEYGQFDVVSVRDLEWAGHSRHTIRTWSDDLEQICYEPPNSAISSMSPVTLMPW